MLSTDDIKKFIEDDKASDQKMRAREGQRYYEGDHDILNHRLFYYNTDGILVEDKARSNIKICHPFFTELADQLPPYILSSDENPIQAKETVKGLQEHLDEYFDDEFWAEISELILGAYVKGFEYLYAYHNEDMRLAFECADSLGVVEVREAETDDGCKYYIHWYVDRVGKDKKLIKRIEVYTENEVYFYTQVDDGDILPDNNVPVNPRPHSLLRDPKTDKYYGKGFGFIPVWRFDNNNKQISGLKPIKGLIDDYDLMQCGLSNNVQDFDTPIHLISGFPGTSEEELAELQQNIKTKKIVSLPDSDGGIDIKTIDIPYQARKVKADEDKEAIYHFGMGFNSSQVGDGNITNVVIRSRYTPLDLKAGKLETRLKRFLKDIVRVVLDEINAKNGTAYQYKDVKIKFEHILPTNEQEDAQNALTRAQAEQTRVNTILNTQALIGDDAALQAICDELDMDYEELSDQLEKLNAERDTLAAQATLNGVVTDEPTAEVNTATLSE